MKNWIILLGIGIIFLLNAVFGRYLVLPGSLSGLEAGRTTIETAGQAVPVWKIIRYLLWAYSFKLGIFFVGIGVLLKTSIPTTRFRLMVGGAYFPALGGGAKTP